MAIVTDNIIMKGMSGTIGKELTYRQFRGKTIVSRYQRPHSVPPTAKKIAAQVKFAKATAYARGAIDNPEIKAMYQSAAGIDQRAFNVAISDALHPPKVDNIELDSYHGHAGDSVMITASDDFKVAAVRVAITDGCGTFVEEGDAVEQADNKHWVYTSTNENARLTGSAISATAVDMPGNIGKLIVFYEDAVDGCVQSKQITAVAKIF